MSSWPKLSSLQRWSSGPSRPGGACRAVTQAVIKPQRGQKFVMSPRARKTSRNKTMFRSGLLGVEDEEIDIVDLRAKC